MVETSNGIILKYQNFGIHSNNHLGQFCAKYFYYEKNYFHNF